MIPLIICLLKPYLPMCQKKQDEKIEEIPEVEDDEYTQSELLQMGGTGLVVLILLGLLLWALSKAMDLRRVIQNRSREETANELKEIRRSLGDGKRLI